MFLKIEKNRLSKLEWENGTLIVRSSAIIRDISNDLFFYL